MRILSINGKNIEIQVDATELDNIINQALEDQWRIGYNLGRNDQAELDKITKEKE